MNQHTIQEALVTFDLFGGDHTRLASKDLISWTKSNVLEAIEHHADNLTAPDSMVEISELNITLNIDNELDFLEDADSIKAIVWDQIYSALKNSLNEKTIVQTPIQKYCANVVLKYIRTGQLATYYSKEEWDDFQMAFFAELMTGTNLKKIGQKIIEDKNSFFRFFALINPDRLNEVLNKLTREKNNSIKLIVLLKFIAENSNTFPPIKANDFYHQAFVLLLKTDDTFEMTFQKIIEEVLVEKSTIYRKLKVPNEISIELDVFLKKNDNDTKKEGGLFDKKTTLKENGLETEINVLEEGSFIGQAGLVLLVPFLPLFLKKLGCIGAKGELLKPYDVPILLHYLTTGENLAPEWKLTLPKVLSGLRPGQHCATRLQPSKKIDIQINEVLKSVITYWEALKNTSTEGLRETFLIRDGVLKSKNGYYYLNIEENTVDILLNYVSWNYTTVKLNWMKSILFVEWNKS